MCLPSHFTALSTLGKKGSARKYKVDTRSVVAGYINRDNYYCNSSVCAPSIPTMIWNKHTHTLKTKLQSVRLLIHVTGVYVSEVLQTLPVSRCKLTMFLSSVPPAGVLSPCAPAVGWEGDASLGAESRPPFTVEPLSLLSRLTASIADYK